MDLWWVWTYSTSLIDRSKDWNDNNFDLFKNWNKIEIFKILFQIWHVATSLQKNPTNLKKIFDDFISYFDFLCIYFEYFFLRVLFQFLR